jgi:hypothetical protein
MQHADTSTHAQGKACQQSWGTTREELRKETWRAEAATRTAMASFLGGRTCRVRMLAASHRLVDKPRHSAVQRLNGVRSENVDPN